MKKEIIQKIIIPEGVEAEINGSVLNVKGKEGESSREFKTDRLMFEKKGNEIILGSKKATRVIFIGNNKNISCSYKRACNWICGSGAV